MKIVLVGEAGRHRSCLSENLTFRHEIISVPTPAPNDVEFAILASTADVIIALRLPRLHRIVRGFRLLQVPGAGVDGIDQASLPEDVWMCNVFEHETPIAEFVLLAMLHWTIGFDALRGSFTPATWTEVYRARTPHREIAGQTIGLIGFGRIARAIAQRARTLGMTVIAIDPSAPNRDGLADVVLPTERLAELLGAADFVVITCPLTGQTRGMLGPAELGAMRSTAVLINVSRAEVIDELALFEVLKNRTIAGAYLDVWYRYPLPGEQAVAPSSLPFHELPNAICTPHSSAWTNGLFERRYRAIAANIDRLHSGKPLANVVRAPAYVDARANA